MTWTVQRAPTTRTPTDIHTTMPTPTTTATLTTTATPGSTAGRQASPHPTNVTRVG